MTPLTQYGRMAEKHWREHRPKMVRELQRKELLHQMLLEAEEKTKDEMATLRMELMKQGSTAQQAQTQAWELVRENGSFRSIGCQTPITSPWCGPIKQYFRAGADQFI